MTFQGGLELELKADRFQAGAKQVEQSLDRVSTTAAKTTAAVGQVGTQLNKAFTAQSGAAAAQGIEQTVTSIGRMNVAAAGFGAAHTAANVGRFVRELREISSNTQIVTRDVYGMVTSTRQAGGVWTALGSVIKAHPLLTIATVISAAAGAMSLFGNKTDEAAEKFEQLAASMRKAQLDEKTARYLGISPLNAQSAQINSLFESLSNALGQGGDTTVGQLQDLGGFGSRGALLSQLAQLGNQQAAEFSASGKLPQRVVGYSGQLGTPYYEPIQTGEFTVTAEQQRELLRQRYRELLGETDTLRRSERSVGGGGTAPGYGDGSLLRTGQDNRFTGSFDRVRINPEHQASIERETQRQIENQERALESARELKFITDQIGGTLGDAAADFALGLGSARQIMAGLLADLIRSGFRQGFQGLVGAIGGAFGGTGTGETFTQQP